jgi:hypothetical protein
MVSATSIGLRSVVPSVVSSVYVERIVDVSIDLAHKGNVRVSTLILSIFLIFCLDILRTVNLLL